MIIELPRATRLRGAFCLLRLIPVLEALRSPLESPCRAVAEWCLADYTDLPDSVLIDVDDYREAASELEGGSKSSVYYDVSIAVTALHAAGVASLDGAPDGELVARAAEGVWWRLTEEIDRLGRPLVDAWRSQPDPVDDLDDPAMQSKHDTVGLLARERTWRLIDEQVIVDDLTDPQAVSSYVAKLRESAVDFVPVLRSHFDQLEVVFRGPCGTECDWPACTAGGAICVRNREYQPFMTLAARLRRGNGGESRPWYVRVLAYDPPPGEPCDFLIEIGADGLEKRKVGVHDDGRREWSGEGRESAVLRLSPEPITTLKVYERREDMMAEEITPSLFGRYWSTDSTVET